MNKLAIVGSGPNTRDLAPYQDNSFDIWVINEAPMNEWCLRWDAAFQLHTPEIYSGPNIKHCDYWEWLQRPHGKTIYMQTEDSRVPDCKLYPLDDAIALGGYKFLGMSCCYMVALALLQGYKHIEVWGIELSWTEYQYGADSWSFWVGFAKGKLGNDFILHSGEKLFDSPLYGYEGAFKFGPGYFEERIEYLGAGWTSADKNLSNLKKSFQRAIERNDPNRVRDLFGQLELSGQDAGEYAGALAEAEKYHNEGAEWIANRNDFELAAASAQLDGEDKKALMFHVEGVCEYLWNVWQQSKNPNAANQLMVNLQGLAQAAYDTGALSGKMRENVGYIQKYDGMVQANGGKVLPHPEINYDK